MDAVLSAKPIECMYCGDRFGSVAESMDHVHMKSTDDTETFEEIWQQECRARGARVQVLFTDSAAPLRVREINKRNLETEQATLSDLVDQLSQPQLTEYGKYRLKVLKEIGKR